MARKLIGHVANTFGLRGALKIILFTDCPEVRFKPGETIEINGAFHKITDCRIKPGLRTAIVEIEGYDDINQSTPLIHYDVYADVEPLPGTIFIDDIIGRDVINTKGEKIGSVKEVAKLNTKDYLIIDIDGEKSRYMPFLAPTFIQSLSETPGKVVLTELGEEALK